jgi:hypothetical protein
MRSRILMLICLMVIILGLVVAWPAINRLSQVTAAQRVQTDPTSVAVPDAYASPIHGGCYIAAASDCRLHVEAFTISIASTKKLVLFQLVTIQGGSGAVTTIYDWRPDLSLPIPVSGDTYTPSLVSQDFAASCGKSYQISLQAMDSGDYTLYNLGTTGQFTCPSSTP